jgi:hypothetical protein
MWVFVISKKNNPNGIQVFLPRADSYRIRLAQTVAVGLWALAGKKEGVTFAKNLASLGP